jgi:hypothetical protein
MQVVFCLPLDQLARDFFDVVATHLHSCCYFNGVFSFPLEMKWLDIWRSRHTFHKKIIGIGKNLKHNIFFRHVRLWWALFWYRFSLETLPPPNVVHVVPLSCQLGQTLVFGCVQEFVSVIRAFAFLVPTLMSFRFKFSLFELFDGFVVKHSCGPFLGCF